MVTVSGKQTHIYEQNFATIIQGFLCVTVVVLLIYFPLLWANKLMMMTAVRTVDNLKTLTCYGFTEIEHL